MLFHQSGIQYFQSVVKQANAQLTILARGADQQEAREAASELYRLVPHFDKLSSHCTDVVRELVKGENTIKQMQQFARGTIGLNCFNQVYSLDERLVKIAVLLREESDEISRTLPHAVRENYVPAVRERLQKIESHLKDIEQLSQAVTQELSKAVQKLQGTTSQSALQQQLLKKTSDLTAMETNALSWAS